MQNHNDTINKQTSEDFFLKNIPLTLFVMFACEWELETEQRLQYIDPHSYGRQRSVFLVLQGCSTGDPEAHSAGCGLSLPHLVTNRSPNTIGGPEGPFGRVWLSLPHLVSNSSDIQLNQGTERPPPPGGDFLYHILPPTSLVPNSLTSCLHRVI